MADQPWGWARRKDAWTVAGPRCGRTRAAAPAKCGALGVRIHAGDNGATGGYANRGLAVRPIKAVTAGRNRVEFIVLTSDA